MLQVKNVYYSLGERQILNGVSFSLSPGAKAALVGANGAGKTTLVRIIVEEISAEEGEVVKPTTWSYVPQVINYSNIADNCGVEEFMMEARGLGTQANRLKTILNLMEHEPEGVDKLLEEYSTVEENFSNNGGYEAEAEIGVIFNGIGLKVELDRKVYSLSGGEKTKLLFARSLFEKGEILILDEPTNHIDRQYYGWLGLYLKNLKKTVLVVSHHPDFIDPFTNRIIEIEKFTGRSREYRGNYSDYLMQSKENEKALQTKIEWLEKEISRLMESALRLQHGGPNKAKAAQNMFGLVHRLEKQRNELAEEMPVHEKKLRLKFLPAFSSGIQVLSAFGLAKRFNGRCLFKNLSFQINRGEKIVILGPNGSGKSTLIKIILGLTGCDEGSFQWGHKVNIGYYAQEHENLNPKNSVLEEVQEANKQSNISLRGLLGSFLFFGDKVFQPVETLSQGEKARLSLCKLIIGGHNLLILDEPTNYLDPNSVVATSEALQDYTGTLILISHDRSFVENIVPDRAIVFGRGIVDYDLKLLNLLNLD